MALPTDDKARKELPVFTGPLMYFPDAIAEVARVCKIGNDQHNPGEPMHWARGKSMDQMNTALRHMMDHGTGNTKDGDAYHLAKAAWRILAELQLTIERDALIDQTGSNPPMPRTDAATGEIVKAYEAKVAVYPVATVKDLRTGAKVYGLAPTGYQSQGTIISQRQDSDVGTEYYVEFPGQGKGWFFAHNLRSTL